MKQEIFNHYLKSSILPIIFLGYGIIDNKSLIDWQNTGIIVLACMIVAVTSHIGSRLGEKHRQSKLNKLFSEAA